MRRFYLVGFLAAVFFAGPFVSSLSAHIAQRMPPVMAGNTRAHQLHVLRVSSLTQETQPQQQDSPSEAGEDDITKWKLINTGIFALLLGFAIIKLAPGFFNARSLDIQKAIKDATGLKIEADFRYSEIDKKMSNLGAEVYRLKAQSNAEMEREHQRLLKETEAEIVHIKHNIAAELEALQEDGIRQVKLHTATLAIGLAERRLQTYYAEGKVIDTIHDFVNLVEQVKN